MKAQQKFAKAKQRRTFRVRNAIRRSAVGRPRLSIFRSNNHMYAQIIDDVEGKTLVSASTIEKDLYGAGKHAGNKEAAAKVGQSIAQRAIEKGIKEVVFDRGPYRYHGRVAALADAAREAGLQF
ncbi:50S ribosomal protein L18 [Thalassoroseus pseudoceratinae]|uniref:50S ribosomal protein L18 n=1 Tax=Thalassoroseus pseudoceratinae TaxID=2713176 RepID=UPI001422FA82|nr:50S ribosomal protein L18 [Thalassoroseus pseudoceratinae]